MKKILVVKPCGGAFDYITLGFINAFKSIGCDAKYWSGDIKEFLSFKPDLYIGCSGHRQKIPDNARQNTKVAIHVNPYGEKLIPLHGININESDEAIKWTISQKPDIVFGYGYKDDENTYWSNWQNISKIKFVGIPTAGDHTLYWPNKTKTNKIVYLGGRWPYKANKIDEWFLPLTKLTDVKIMGWGGWQGIKGYIGPLDKSDSGREFLANGMIGPCICEPHTSKYGIDIPERFFKLALCKTLPIIDYVPKFNRYYKDGSFLMARNPSEYMELILNYSNNPDFNNKRNELSEEIYRSTLKNHTYLNRMKYLCENLLMNDLVDKFNDKINHLSFE